MCRHATLAEWTSKSSIWHATSAIPTGPYTLVDMVAQPWSHNAMLSADPAGGYLLYQIGDAVVPPDQWEPCYNSSDIPQPAVASAAQVIAGRRGRGGHPRPRDGSSGIYIRSAPELTGPWTLEVRSIMCLVDWPFHMTTPNLLPERLWHCTEHDWELGHRGGERR